jgi:hypothetical protein
MKRAKRAARTAVYQGKVMPLSDIVAASGSKVPLEAVANRLFRYGWPLERALTMPMSPQGRHLKAPVTLGKPLP